MLLFLVLSFSACQHGDEADPTAESKPAAETGLIKESGLTAESEASLETDGEGALTAPSLSLFESASVWQIFEGAEKLTAREVREIPGQLSSLSSRSQPTRTAEKAEDGSHPVRDSRYMILPMLLFRARHVFREPPWTAEETDLVIELAGLLAEAFDQSEFRGVQRDEASIRHCLVRIKDWFERACEDDQTLASMLATFDDGPFFGERTDDTESAPLVELARTSVEETSGWLIVGKSSPSERSLIMQYRDSAERLVWSRRITAGSEEVREPIRFADRPVEYHKGFGFRVNLYATWTYGTERMHVYLDEDGSFRFYFLSW